VGDIGTVLNCDIVANITGDNEAVIDACRNTEIVMPEHDIPQRSDAYHAVKRRIANQGRIKGIAHNQSIPIGTGIIISDKDFKFFRLKIPPNFPLGDLGISDPEFVFSRRKVL